MEHTTCTADKKQD